VLVVTTTVGMLHRILRYTTDLRPAVALHGVLVVGAPSLQEGLVGTPAACNDTDLGANGRRDGLLSAARKPQPRRALVLVVRYDNGERARTARKGPTVAQLCFDVADDGTLRDRREWEDIPYTQCSLLPAVHELAGVHTFRAKQELVIALVVIWAPELDFRNRSATAWIVEDLFYHTTYIAVFLSIIISTKLNGPFAGPSVCLEDG